MTNNRLFTQSQIEQLSSLRYINRIDEHMRIVASVKVMDEEQQDELPVLLILDIFFDDQQVEKMSFNLHNYSFDEIIETAQHIGDNDFIMRAVDTVLAGEIE